MSQDPELLEAIFRDIKRNRSTGPDYVGKLKKYSFRIWLKRELLEIVKEGEGRITVKLRQRRDLSILEPPEEEVL